MRFKVTYYNPVTYKVRHDEFNFVRDDYNHCWIKDRRMFYCDPRTLVDKWADYLKNDGEYVTIKLVRTA